MKIKGILWATISLLGISGAFAQGVEYDDMYFNAKDREKLNAQRASEAVAYHAKDTDKRSDIQEDEISNPTDSYSARNVNPEYISRSHTESAQADNEDYFVNNYQYQSNQLNNWNNNYNQWYNSSWYRPNYYGPGINSWNSPYYGYNSYNSPWYDPFWANSGWSSSFSYHFGPAYNYGWGGNYNYWNRPYYGYSGWDPYYGSAYNYYGGGYWNNYRYPRTIVVVNNGNEAGRKVVYGKRPTRSNSVVSDQSGSRPRSSGFINSGRTDNSTGRTRQQEYYNRTQSNSGYGTYENRTSTQNNRSRSWDNSNYNNSNSSGRTSSSPSYSPSYNSGGGGATRSTGSGTNGRTRGRD
jgi:hypothetical protein